MEKNPRPKQRGIGSAIKKPEGEKQLSLRPGPLSATFALFDALSHRFKLPLQLVLVVLQAFLLILRGVDVV